MGISRVSRSNPVNAAAEVTSPTANNEWRERGVKYMVITKVFDNGREQVLKPQPSTVEKSYSTHKFNYDFYVDVFDSFDEARDFYIEQK